jgi:hypothetical protein
MNSHPLAAPTGGESRTAFRDAYRAWRDRAVPHREAAAVAKIAWSRDAGMSTPWHRRATPTKEPR